MFVVIVSFPPIKAEKEAEFEKWFALTNHELSSFKGFIRRSFEKLWRVVIMPPLSSLKTRTLSWLCMAAPFTPRPGSRSYHYLTANLHRIFMELL